MIVKFGIPLFAAIALGFGIATLSHLTPREQLLDAPNPPPLSNLGLNTISGLGEVQMAGEPIAIATPISGIVSKVFVIPGQNVSEGEPLFALDDRALRAELHNRMTSLATANAKLLKLKAGTRPEDLPPAMARVAAATAAFKRNEDAWNRAELLIEKKALSEEEHMVRKYAYDQADAELAQTKADLAKLVAGTWSHDIEIAEHEVASAKSSVEQIRVDLDRLVIRAPVDGLVLHVDVRPGEYAESTRNDNPLVQLGLHGPLRVRVQFDEEDASRISPGARAEGFIRGRDRTPIELRFIRIDPRIVPKKSMTGGMTERVDTRVLFVVYEIVGAPPRIYAGQKLDVFMEG